MDQHRRQNRWNEPFEIHDTLPIVLKEMVGSDGKLGEMKIDMKFTKAVLQLTNVLLALAAICPDGCPMEGAGIDRSECNRVF